MWQRIKALVWKEFLQLRRDRLTVVMIFFIASWLSWEQA